MNKLYSCLLSILLSLHTLPAHTLFNSMTQVKRYAQTIPENPKPDNNNWTNPSFDSYYKTRKSGYFKKFAHITGITQDIWDTTQFKKLLKAVIEISPKAHSLEELTTTITPGPETKFIIMGNLQASFHSLVRYLETLKKWGVLDEQFKIINQNYYIVFDGNAITGFANGIDTLALILRIMLNNNEHVIYITGTEEYKQEWENKQLGKEIAMRFSVSDAKIITNLINQFLENLPRTLYVVAQATDKNIDLVGIYSDELELLEFKGDSTTQTNSVRALIRGEKYSKDNPNQLHGLRNVGTDNNTITWAILSGPIGSYRITNQFFYDAFVVLTTAKKLTDWTLTLYNQDIRNPKGITPKKMYNLLTGQEYITQDIEKIKTQEMLEQKQQAEQQLQVTLNELKNFTSEKDTEKTKKNTTAKLASKETKQELVFGSIMDLSRNQEAISQQDISGIELAFDNINRAGGINGNRLVLTVLDDEYDPKKTRERAQSLIDHHLVQRLLMPLGSATLETYLDLVKAEKLLVLAPNTGSSLFRNPDLKFIIHFRASYAEECRALAHYAIKTLNAKKIVLFYQKDVKNIDGILDYFNNIGFKDYVEIVYSPKETNFEKQISHINEARADTYIFLSIPSSTLELIRQIGIQNLAGKNLLGWSDLVSEQFYNFVRSRGLNMVLSSVVPDPNKSNLPIVKKYRAAIESKGLSKNADSLEGYINGTIVTEILKNINGQITNKKIISSAESFKNFDLGGINLNFDFSKRTLVQTVWLDTGEGDWQKVVSPSEKLSDNSQPKEQKIGSQNIKHLSIGSTIDLSRGNKLPGQTVDQVIKYIFDQNNNANLLREIKLDWVAMDDEYTPAKSRENIEQLLKKKIDIIMNPMGGENFMAFIDFVQSNSILVLFPQPGVPDNHSPDLKSCIYFRPSFTQEGIANASYVAEKIKPKKVVLFYQDDAFGRALELGTKEVLEKAKIQIISIPYQRNDAHIEQAVDKIKQIAPDCIGLLANQQAAKMLLQQLGNAFVKNIQFFGPSDLNQIAIRSYIEQNNIKCIVSNVVPNPLTSSLPIVQEFRAEMKKAGIPADTIALEAYIGARLLIDIINKIKGPIDKETIRKAFEEIKNYDFHGLPLNFDPETRQLSHTIWLDTEAEEWIATTSVRPQEKKQTIVIGSTMDLSRTNKTFGLITKNILEAFFNTVNHENILGERTIKIYVLDDEYNPQKARANVERLIKEYNIQALLSPLGSASLQKYLDLVNKGEIDVLFARADSPVFTKRDLKNIINFSASAFEFGYVVLKYASKASSISKLVLFYEASVEGYLDGAKKAVSESHIENLTEISYVSSNIDYSMDAKKIKNENPDTIMFLSDPTPTLSLIKLLGADFLVGKMLLGGNVMLNTNNFKNMLHEKELNMIIPSLVPNPKTSTLPIVKDFRRFAATNNIELDPLALYVYMSARIFVEIIKKIDGPVTKQKIIEIAEHFKDFDLGGIPLSFDPQTRRLINKIWIDNGKEEWQEISIEDIN